VTERRGLRGGLRRLSSGLIAYGLLGLALAAIGFGALVWVDGRVSALRGEVETTLRQESTVVALAGGVLHDAATTVRAFDETVGQSSRAVTAAAATVTEARSDLVALEAQLRSFNILGATPLSSSADAVGRIATSLEGLDAQLPVVAGGLDDNRVVLAANAASLDRLGDAAEALAARLRSGVVDDSLGELQLLISVTLLVFTAWSLLPALGALALGAWMRRELRRSRSS
jgi:hypothetical protein